MYTLVERAYNLLTKISVKERLEFRTLKSSIVEIDLLSYSCAATMCALVERVHNLPTKISGKERLEC